MKYYTADTHFGHNNVIGFDDRPFANTQEMDRFMIDAWNSRVKDDDEVYIVGDFMYRSEHSVEYYAKRLNGRKYLILGNHDKLTPEDERCFVGIEKMMHVCDYYEGRAQQICLCHFPIAEWNGYKRGHYHIYAHIHNQDNDTYRFMKNRAHALNAGCMINNYIPVTFGELVENNEVFKREH